MTDSPTKKFRILNISASDYIHSRNFPKTISNNPHLPEKPPHYYQVEIKPLSTEILSAQLKKEDLKNSYSMISAAIQENKLLYKQNLTIQEDNSKLSAVKKNLQNQVVEEVILKSDKRVRINDGFDIGEAEKVKRSGVINSNNSGESFRIKELEIELSLEKNKNCNLIQEKNELLNELAKMRSHLPGIRDPMANQMEMNRKLQEAERKIIILVDEIEKLRFNLKKFGDSSSVDEEKLASLTSEIQRLQLTISNKQSIIRELEIKLHSQEDNRFFDEKIVKLSSENQRLNSHILMKQETINELESKLRIKPINSRQDNQKLEEKIVVLSTEAQRLNSLLALKQEKMFEIESKLHFLESGRENYMNLENKVSLLSIENQRLIALLELKKEEILNLERKITFLETKTSESGLNNTEELMKMRNVMEDLNYQNGNLKMKFEGIERELFMKINELEQKYNEKERESISNLAIIRNNEQELIDLRNENRFLKGEIDDVKSEKIKRSNFDSEKNRMFSDFQREKEILMRENDGLKLKLDQSEKDRLFFFEQIDDLKRNLKIKNEELYGLEQQKFIEIERIRLEYEETQNKDIQSLIKEATLKLNSDIQNLEKQIKNYKNTIFELENKISLIIKENERISVAYDQKMKEIDVLNYRAQNLERVRAQELEQMRVELEKRNSETFESQIYDLRITYESDKRNFQIEIKELQQKAIDYENKINFFTIEIERLNAIIVEKQQELDEFKIKYNEASINLKKIKDIHLISYADVKSNAENSKIEVEIRYLQGKLKEYEAENSHLKRQIDDYKLFNHKRMTEIGEWKERISSGFESVDDFKKNYEEYLNLKKDFQEITIQRKIDIENYEIKIRDLSISLENKKIELSELSKLLNNEKEERKRIQNQVTNLQNDFINQKSSSKMYFSSSNNSENLRTENNELKKQIADLGAKMMTLREEVIRKNEILNQRIMEMEMSKRKFDEELKKLHEKSISNHMVEDYQIYTTMRYK